MECNIEVYDEERVRKGDEEIGYMGSFPTLGEAQEYVESHEELFKNGHYYKDIKTGKIIIDLWLSVEELNLVKAASKELGVSENEFINKTLEDFIEKEKKMEASLGQVSKFPGESDLYVIGFKINTYLKNI